MILVLFNTSAFGKVIGDVILQEGNSVVERKEGDEFDSNIDLDAKKFSELTDLLKNISVSENPIKTSKDVELIKSISRT